MEMHYITFSGQSLSQKILGLTSLIEVLDDAAFYDRRHQEEGKLPVIKWIENNGLFDKLFCETAHLEVIKRSFALAKFLAKHNAISHSQLLQIYALAADNHQSLKTTLMQGLYELVEQLSLPEVETFFNMIVVRNHQKVDADYLGLIKAMVNNPNVVSFGASQTTMKEEEEEEEGQQQA